MLYAMDAYRLVVGLLIPITLGFMVAGCLGTPASMVPLPLAPEVNVERMYGGWYIVATIPNSFEKGLVGMYDEYSARPDGDIWEDFYFQKGSFATPRKHYRVHDWVKPGTNNAHWRVQLFWPINLPFLIHYVDPDYRYVLFGENNRKVGWIYSRTATLDEATYQQLLARFAAAGYDATQFRRTVQLPEQIGKPGFWSDGVAEKP
jgi:apolipoprotein D and lipocalin family protein